MKEKTKTTSIGGQAVMEGIMMRGSSSMALAVRDSDGDIQLETYRTNSRKWYNKVPVLRGIISFVSSLIVGMKMLTRSTEISASEDESIGKGGMAIAVILGLLLAVGLFIVVPELLAGLVRDHLLKNLESGIRVLLYSLTGGVIRITMFILYLVFCSKLKDIRRTFMYHGAEHKTINCYEHGEELTVENIQKHSTIHRRCGTTFLFLVMMISILLFAFANWFFEIYDISLGDSRILQNLGRMIAKLILLPFVAGFAYEVLKLFAKLPYNLFTKIIMAPGLALQKLTTAQPDDGMVEVALKSFTAVMEMDQNPNIEEIEFYNHRCSDVIKQTVSQLKKIDAEEAEAYWILSHVTGIPRSGLATVKTISNEQYKEVKNILSKRMLREPLDYILGYSVFYGHKIIVNKDVLIPRMETETLVEQAIKEIGNRACKECGDKTCKEIGDKACKESGDKACKESGDKACKESGDKACSVLDLCTGSGCIALAILSQTSAKVTAADISQHALDTAALNLENKECDIVLSDFFSNIEKKFDIIISNPPYIRSKEIPTLQPEVIYQPKLALDGGTDGIYYYREIIRLASGYLNKNGVMLLEIGHDQAADVTALLAKDFKNISVTKDLSGSDRVIRAELKDSVL